MSRKFNNKYLVIILVVLGALFVFIKFYKSPRTEKTLRTDIVQIDTSKVSKIVINPSSEPGSEVIFRRETGNEWTVNNGKVDAKTGKNSLKNLLSQLIEIKPIRLESRSKESWKDYNLTDSAATRILAYEDDEEILNIYIGKFTYQQTNDPYSGGRGGVKGTSYVRLAGEDEIYAVDGFLSFAFNQPFSSWRDQTFLNIRKSDVTKLTFMYPGDSSFVVSLQNNKWMLGNQLADSAKVAGYISSISSKTFSKFDDEFEPVGNPPFWLTIEGNNMETVTVNAYQKEDGKFAMNSLQNPDVWFNSERNGLFKDIYKGMSSFK